VIAEDKFVSVGYLMALADVAAAANGRWLSPQRLGEARVARDCTAGLSTFSFDFSHAATYYYRRF
jgi:hypothetical protein